MKVFIVVGMDKYNNVDEIRKVFDDNDKAEQYINSQSDWFDDILFWIEEKEIE